MKQYKDSAIILSRVDYGERDRILTLLCSNEGRVSVLAKSVRSQKSRLAGGIELLSESEVSFVEGKSSLMTLTSARLAVHFSHIVNDVQRMQQAFSYLKTINSIIDNNSGQEYYDILKTALAGLNDSSHDLHIIDTWFNLQLLKVSGCSPNLLLESNQADNFEFDYDLQQFSANKKGAFKVNDLKVIRLCLSGSKPPKLNQALGSEGRLQSWSKDLLKTNIVEV